MISMAKYRLMGILLLTMTLPCCKVYRFTDASINPNIKTVTIQTFPNLAAIQVPNLSLVMTNKLKLKFQRESNLDLLSNGGDIEFNGSIVNYSIEPATLSNTETVDQNRLTISVKVEYTDRIDSQKSFSQVFTDNEVYAASEDISTVESRLIDIITDKLVQNIFNRAFANW